MPMPHKRLSESTIALRKRNDEHAALLGVDTKGERVKKAREAALEAMRTAARSSRFSHATVERLLDAAYTLVREEGGNTAKEP